MTTKTHAQTINEQYLKSDSHFVTLQERLSEALKTAPLFVGLLTGVVDEFKRRHKDWTTFTDLLLCKAIMVPMDKILIDTTTAISLYIILTKVFGERTAQTMVPVVVYNVKHKLEIRRNFILLNGDAKEELDFIDKYKQMVYGSKVDGADDTEWTDTAKKNDYLASAGLFATHSKFGDEDQPGAFSLLADTLMSKSLKTRKDPEVTRMFATYWTYLNQERAVEPKEARQLYEYFNLCFEQNITVDEAYLLEFAAFTKEYFDGDFGPNGPFWDKVKMSYEEWYKKANPESYAESGLRGFTSEMRTGIPFLIAQVKKSTKLSVPTYSANNGFTVAKKDLW